MQQEPQCAYAAESMSYLAAAGSRELAVHGAVAVPQHRLKALEANSMDLTVSLGQSSTCMAMQGAKHQLPQCCCHMPAPAEGLEGEEHGVMCVRAAWVCRGQSPGSP